MIHFIQIMIGHMPNKTQQYLRNPCFIAHLFIFVILISPQGPSIHHSPPPPRSPSKSKASKINLASPALKPKARVKAMLNSSGPPEDPQDPLRIRRRPIWWFGLFVQWFLCGLQYIWFTVYIWLINGSYIDNLWIIYDMVDIPSGND